MSSSSANTARMYCSLKKRNPPATAEADIKMILKTNCKYIFLLTMCYSSNSKFIQRIIVIYFAIFFILLYNVCLEIPNCSAAAL